MLLGMVDKRRNYWIKRQNILKSPQIRTIGGEALISVTGETLKTFKEPEKDVTHYYHYFPLQLDKKKNRI